MCEQAGPALTLTFSDDTSFHENDAEDHEEQTHLWTGGAAARQRKQTSHQRQIYKDTALIMLTNI